VAVDRSLIGSPAAYAADESLSRREHELWTSQRARREVAWQVAERVLLLVAMSAVLNVVLALIRTVRMLRDACLSAGDRAEVVAALNRQIGLALEAYRATRPPPEDLAKLEAVAGAPPDQLPTPLPTARP